MVSNGSLLYFGSFSCDNGSIGPELNRGLRAARMEFETWCRVVFGNTLFSQGQGRVEFLKLLPPASPACGKCTPAPDMQGHKAKSKQPLRRWARTRLALVGAGGLDQHLAGERLVSVHDGGGIPPSTPNKGSLCSNFVSFQSLLSFCS